MQGGIGKGICRGSGIAEPSHGESLRSVGFQKVHPSPIQRVCGVRISRDELAGIFGYRRDAIFQALTQKSFSVILKNDRIHRGDEGRDSLAGTVNARFAGHTALLAIHSDDLLLAGDDAGFNNGGTLRIGD